MNRESSVATVARPVSLVSAHPRSGEGGYMQPVRNRRFEMSRLCWLNTFLTSVSLTAPCNWLSITSAADWPQWQGPDRTAVSKETGLLQEWPKEGPPLAWKGTGLGKGMGGIA